MSDSYIYEEKYQPWFVWTLILAPCFMPFVWNYHIQLDQENLSFGYSAKCGQLTLERKSIKTAEVIAHINGLCEWGGYGIRKQLPSWETGYITKNGPGVRLTYNTPDGKEKAVTFSCADPEQLVNYLTGGK